MLFGFRVCAVGLARTVCVSLHERNTFICGTYPHIATSLCRRLSDCPRADPDAMPEVEAEEAYRDTLDALDRLLPALLQANLPR